MLAHQGVTNELGNNMPIPKVLVGLGLAAAVLAKEALEEKADDMRRKRKRRKRIKK